VKYSITIFKHIIQEKLGSFFHYRVCL